MRDFMIGQYYPIDSIIHRFDPRTKLFATLIFAISLFINNNIYGLIIITFALICAIIMCRVPFMRMLRGLRFILFLLLFSSIFNVFFTKGHVLIEAGFIHITEEGLIKAGYIAFRLICLIIGASIITFTTKPMSFADGIEKSLSPLRYFKIPVHELAMMISIAIRFIPILMAQMDVIIKAQKSRGARFDGAGIIGKLKAFVPLLVPLFVSAIKRAGELADAMDARCYNSNNIRTKMKPLSYMVCDYVGYIICLIYLVSIITIRLKLG